MAKYLVVNQSGEIQNIIEAMPDFKAGNGLSEILASKFPAAQIGDSIIGNSLVLASGRPEAGEQKSARIAAQADAIYTQQPVASQAAFAPLYVAVKDAVALGRFDVAHDIVMGAAVPAELVDVRNQIASLLK